VSVEVVHARFTCVHPTADAEVIVGTVGAVGAVYHIPSGAHGDFAALEVLSSLLASVERSVPASRVILLGFSQGACLTLEFAARHARSYGAVVGLSGGLIGPDGTPRDYQGSFDGTPALLGCSDVDPHIAKARVLEAGDVLKRMGAAVTVKLYPNMAHTVNADELHSVAQIVEAVAHEVA